jgi:hypothetical protein
MKQLVSLFFLISGIRFKAGSTPVIRIAMLAFALLFAQSLLAQDNLCDLDPNWPEITQSNSPLTFHLYAGQCVVFQVVDSCWCPSTPPNVCVCSILIQNSSSENVDEFVYPCHEVLPDSMIAKHHWQGATLVEDNPRVACWSVPSDDYYTFTVDFCAREKVTILCWDCQTYPCP